MQRNVGLTPVNTPTFVPDGAGDVIARIVSPGEAEAFVKLDIERWGHVVRQTKFRMD